MATASRAVPMAGGRAVWRRPWWRLVAVHLILLVVAAAIIFPIYWMLTISLKLPREIYRLPSLWPRVVTLDNYRTLIDEKGFLTNIRNSLIVAGSATVVSITVGSLAAYAMARFRLAWTKFYLLALLAISMFPQIAIAGPVWTILNHLDWLNSYQGLVTAYIALSLPLAIWILTTFFHEVPIEIEEAALIDGCSRLQALRKVVFPLAAPGILTAALLVFIHTWNEFFFALIIMTDPDLQTLPVGIALFPGEYTMPWGEIAAASTLATLPLILLTLFFQRGIVRGLSAGAVKG
jgi:multiple sugar transport system permease protein